MSFESYECGSRYPILKGKDNTFVDYTSTGLALFIRYGNMKGSEVRDIKNGVFSYGCYWDGEVIYFLFRFGTAQWIDAPYHKNLTPDQNNIVKFSSSEERETLLIIAGEATTGECKAIRFVTLNREFSDKIRELIAMQNSNITANQIYERIDRTYATIPTTDMVKDAAKNDNIF